MKDARRVYESDTWSREDGMDWIGRRSDLKVVRGQNISAHDNQRP